MHPYTEKAIQKAIEGEWGSFEGEKVEYYDGILFSDVGSFRMTMEEIVLDPTFWKSLGKAMDKFDDNPSENNYKTWLHNWHRLIDTLAEGGTAEEFFKSIIK